MGNAEKLFPDTIPINFSNPPEFIGPLADEWVMLGGDLEDIRDVFIQYSKGTLFEERMLAAEFMNQAIAIRGLNADEVNIRQDYLNKMQTQYVHDGIIPQIQAVPGYKAVLSPVMTHHIPIGQNDSDIQFICLFINNNVITDNSLFWLYVNHLIRDTNESLTSLGYSPMSEYLDQVVPSSIDSALHEPLTNFVALTDL
jgi:hypothetical protein